MEQMENEFDDQNKIYVNEALIHACNVRKYEMVLNFLNKGFQITDKVSKGCEIGKEEPRQIQNFLPTCKCLL